MIRWLDPLYVSESAKQDLERTKRRIKRHRGLLDIYVLILSTNRSDQIDIIHANYLLQPWFVHRELIVVGIAKSKWESVQLAVRLVDEAMREHGCPDLRTYLEQKLT